MGGSMDMDGLQRSADKATAMLMHLQQLAYLATSPNYADDAAAKAGGVPIGSFYRNGSVMMVRVS